MRPDINVQAIYRRKRRDAENPVAADEASGRNGPGMAGTSRGGFVADRMASANLAGPVPGRPAGDGAVDEAGGSPHAGMSEFGRFETTRSAVLHAPFGRTAAGPAAGVRATAGRTAAARSASAKTAPGRSVAGSALSARADLWRSASNAAAFARAAAELCRTHGSHLVGRGRQP